MREIAKVVQGIDGNTDRAPSASHDAIPVVVCTDKRGVVFGYCENTNARPITLTKARMCLYWSSDVGGVFGLGERGPSKDSKVSAVLASITLEGVTAIFSVDPIAEMAWNTAKVQGQ
jgi:hypothetical protein